MQAACSPEYALDQSDEVDSAVILEKHLNNFISIKINELESIEYCPDNTCESFRKTTKDSFDKLADFSFIYLFSVSDYYALSNFKEKDGLPYIHEIMDRNKSGCDTGKGKELVKCILLSMSDKYSIKIFFIRFDEYSRNEVEIDLQEQIERLE